MSLFRLSNHIFELGLDAQELSVYAYLCSFPADTKTIAGKATIKVRQLYSKWKAFSYSQSWFSYIMHKNRRIVNGVGEKTDNRLFDGYPVL